MSDAEQLWQLAVASQQRGDWAAAEQAFCQLLALAPGQPEFLYGMAQAVSQGGRHEAAIQLLASSIQQRADHAPLLVLLGTLQREIGNPTGALQSFEHALTLDPNLWQAHYNQGNVLHQLGNLDAAAAQYRAALRHVSTDPDVFFNLGVVERQLDHRAESQRCFERVLVLNPNYAEAVLQLGHLEAMAGNQQAAIARYHRAVEISPGRAKYWRVLGRAILHAKDAPDAIHSLLRATSLDPQDSSAWAELGNAYEANGMADRAVSCFERAAATSGDGAWRVKAALTFPIIMESSTAIDRTRHQFDQDLARLAAQSIEVRDPMATLQTPAFALAYHGRNDREFQVRIASLLASCTPSLTYVAKHCDQPRHRRRIRIGFVSTNFREHTIGKLNAGLIQHLDRARFEVLALGTASDSDALSRRIASSVDHWVNLPRDLEAARSSIEQQQLDIVFYTDIGIAPLTYYLAHARLAPIQCVTWGHPLTTGIPAIDFFISSEALESPGTEGQYSERLVRLPRLPNFYFHPEFAPTARSRESYGLEPGQRVYACLQSPFKIHPDDDRQFAAILEADPRGVVLLLESPFSHWTELLKSRFARSMPQHCERIRFISQQPPAEFSRLLTLVDALLDPIHFSGGDTSYQSFAVQAPVITLPSTFLRGRITSALYQQLGVSDPVASSLEDYVDKAVRLANDRTWRDSICAGIGEQSGEIFENVAGVRALEEFLEQSYSELP